MTTQARSLNQTKLVQQRKHQQCPQDNNVSLNSSEDSHLDISRQQHQSKEPNSDTMMIDDDEQKNVTPVEIVYESQHNSHRSAGESDKSEQQRHNNKDQIMQQQRQSSQQEENICAGCNKAIKDRYLLEALDKHWHEDCLKCAGCNCRLGELGSSLFINAGKILCKHDFLRIFGNEGCCAACKKVIPPYEMVMRANKNAYHMDCFACQQCNYRFCVGDKFHLQDDHKIICLLCQCENDSLLSSQTSGSSFSQSNANFTSREGIYEQQNQQNLNYPNQQSNNVATFEYTNHNQHQPANRSKQHYYQIQIAKSQSNVTPTKTSHTPNQPQQRLNSMLLASNNNILETNVMNNSMLLNSEMHIIQQSHYQQQQPIYRSQHQVAMNQHCISMTQQNLPRMQQMNNFNMPPNNQQQQSRSLSFVPHNPNQHVQQQNRPQMLNQTKQQVLLHHQHYMEPTPKFHMQQINGGNMQQHSHNHQQNQMQQPSLSTIHHRARKFDAQDTNIVEQQQTHSNQSIKEEIIGTSQTLFETCSPANNCEDNIVDIATKIASSAVSAAPTTYIKQQDQDCRNHQQIYVKNEPLPMQPVQPTTATDTSEKVVDEMLDATQSPSKLERDIMDNVTTATTTDCVGGDDDLAVAQSENHTVTISMKQRLTKQPVNSCKKRKTKDETNGGIYEARTIEALLRDDPSPESEKPNNDNGDDKTTELQASESCSIMTAIDNSIEEEVGNLQQRLSKQHQQHYVISNSASVDDNVPNEERATASESSTSMSSSGSVGDAQQLNNIELT